EVDFSLHHVGEEVNAIFLIAARHMLYDTTVLK
ncbi:hypothetical protein L195_g064698, partial [Trifolium pratense]